MEWRFLASAIIVNTVGIAIFSFLYPCVRVQNSISAVAAVADDAILLGALFAGSGFVLLLMGLVRRASLSYIQTGILAMGNFVVGISSLLLWFVSSIGYGDDLAACGGFPPGYWTSGNATVNRCSIFVSAHEDWVSYIYIAILLTSAIAFWAAIAARLRIMKRKEEAEESDGRIR